MPPWHNDTERLNVTSTSPKAKKLTREKTADYQCPKHLGCLKFKLLECLDFGTHYGIGIHHFDSLDRTLGRQHLLGRGNPLLGGSNPWEAKPVAEVLSSCSLLLTKPYRLIERTKSVTIQVYGLPPFRLHLGLAAHSQRAIARMSRLDGPT